jgi:hypothetical protein
LSFGSQKVLLGTNQTQKDIDAYFNVNGAECPNTTPFVINATCAACLTDKPLFNL